MPTRDHETFNIPPVSRNTVQRMITMASTNDLSG